MDRAFSFFRTSLILVILFLLTISGCNYPFPQKAIPVPPTLPPKPPPTALPTIELTVEPSPIPHVLIPVTGSGKEQTIHDQVNKSYASQKRAYGGDEYRNGRFERPFNKNMEYLGYLDIVKVTMTREDPVFVFVKIQVADPVVPATGGEAYYGLELDLNLDGRSVYLIRGARPFTEEWSVNGVDVWKSTSSMEPMAKSPGIPITGAFGFDLGLLLEGKGDDVDMAWIRLSPGTTDTVEIAFKNQLVDGPKGKFVWRPFTDGAPFHPNLYDLQNTYTLEQAGSPIAGEMDYPLKEVHSVDNTCRVASGYEATGKEPGLCPLPPPPGKPDKPGDTPPEPTEEIIVY